MPSLHGWDQWVFCDEFQHCLGAHPTSSCLHSVLTYTIPGIFWKSIKIYTPLYLLLSLVRLKSPNKYLLENIIRSSVFLTGYTSTVYLTLMWYTSMIEPTISKMTLGSFAWLSGFWLFVERKERWPELTTYCSAQALNSLLLQSKKYGYIKKDIPISIYYMIFIISAGILMNNTEDGMVTKIIEGNFENDQNKVEISQKANSN